MYVLLNSHELGAVRAVRPQAPPLGVGLPPAHVPTGPWLRGQPDAGLQNPDLWLLTLT